jgi:hypothetical protein
MRRHGEDVAALNRCQGVDPIMRKPQASRDDVLTVR